MRRLVMLALGTSALGLAIGCGGAKQNQAKWSNPSAAPAWYDQPADGCSAGSAKYRGNRDMARTAATSRARDDLSRQLQTRVHGMVKDYGAEGEAGGESFSEEQVSRVSRQITDQTLVGTRVVQAEIIDDEMFALVCLQPEVFAESFAQMNELSERAREALQQRAQREFADMDTQLEKLQTRPN